MSHFFHLNITIFTAVKYCSILHGHVCVMVCFLQINKENVWRKKVAEDFQNLVYYRLCFAGPGNDLDRHRILRALLDGAVGDHRRDFSNL